MAWQQETCGPGYQVLKAVRDELSSISGSAIRNVVGQLHRKSQGCSNCYGWCTTDHHILDGGPAQIHNIHETSKA